MLLRWLPLLVVASAVSIAGPAWSADPVELVYLRSGKAAVCPDKAALAQAVGKRLGYQPFFAAAERKLVAEISSKGSVLSARATLVDSAGVVRGDRQLNAPVGECAELIASLALAISITLDPMSIVSDKPAILVDHEAATPPTPATERTEDRAGVSAPTAAAREAKGTQAAAPSRSLIESTAPNADTASQRASSEGALQLDAYLGGSAIIGTLPQAAPALRLGVELARGRGALALEFSGTSVVSQAGTAGSQADMSVLFASAVPCFMSGRLGACAVVSLGSWQGEGRNIEAPRSESHFYASAGLRMSAFLPVAGPLRLRFYAGSAANLTRPSFELASTEVWRPPFLSLEVGAALTAHFL